MDAQGMAGESVYEFQTSQDHYTRSNDNYWFYIKLVEYMLTLY